MVGVGGKVGERSGKTNESDVFFSLNLPCAAKTLTDNNWSINYLGVFLA